MNFNSPLKAARVVPTWGRGIERMFGACRAAGFPAPVMEYEATGLWVKFPFSPEVIEASEKGSVKGSVKSSAKTSEALRDLLRQNPQMTLAEENPVLPLCLQKTEFVRHDA